MKAVIMAGGSGSRLRPLTVGRPKPMVPLVNKPVIAHLRDLLQRQQIDDLVVTLQYLPEVIQDYLGDGSDYGMRITYSVEQIPLGTAGSVKHVEDHLDDTFLVVSGDAITDFDLQAAVAFHRQKKALATLVLYRVPNPLEYGVIILDEEGRVRQFQEKPGWGEVMSDTVNTGLYILEPRVLDYLEPGVPFDFSQNLFPLLLERGEPLYGYVAGGYWCDIGDVQEYMRATRDVLEGRVNLPPIGQHIGGGIWVEDDVEIAPDAQLYGPIFLGRGVKIKGAVVIRGPTVIREYTVVDNRAQIERSVIWRNCYIGEGAEVHGAIIQRQCNIKSHAMLFDGVVVGDNSVIGQGAILHAGVRIWPDKEIEPGAVVRDSIIWESRRRRVLFGRFGVTGLVNVDLTPERAARLGAAFAASLPKGSTVIINRDPHRSPRMIKRAIISGLPSAGVNVLDTQSMPIPVARYYTRISKASGGIHVRLSPFDNRVVDIKFFDANGLNLSKAEERRIERVFFREDFRRVYLDEIGTIAYAPQVVEQYREGFLAALNAEAIRTAGFNLVMDYANAPAVFVLPEILTELGCHVTALNANVDENKMSVPKEEFEQGLQKVARITSVLEADLGVRLDVGGEEIYLVDHRGRLLSDVQAAAALVVLALRARPGATVAVPVDLPRLFDELARRYGGRVIRTRVDPHDLMATCAQQEVVIGADGEGSFVFPEFQPVVDGLFAVAKLLEFLATEGTQLAAVVDELPPCHVAERSVACPWEHKGAIMRQLHEQFRERELEHVDGVKIHLDDAWVLVLPDADRPSFTVCAEASSDEQAAELAEQYARLVEDLLASTTS